MSWPYLKWTETGTKLVLQHFLWANILRRDWYYMVWNIPLGIPFGEFESAVLATSAPKFLHITFLIPLGIERKNRKLWGCASIVHWQTKHCCIINNKLRVYPQIQNLEPLGLLQRMLTASQPDPLQSQKEILKGFLYIYKDMYLIMFVSNSFLNNLRSSPHKHSYFHYFLSDLVLLLIQ